MSTQVLRFTRGPWSRVKNQAIEWFTVQWRLHTNLLAFLGGVALCGLLFGAVIAGQLNSQDAAVLGNAIGQLIQAVDLNQLASTQDVWWSRVVADCQLLALVWLFGVTVIGLPFIVVTVFLRAFSMGFSVGFTVLQFGWKGLAIVATTMFVHQVLSLAAIILAGALAIRFSMGLLRQTTPVTRLPRRLLLYTCAFALPALILIVAAAFQAYVSPGLLTGLLANR